LRALRFSAILPLLDKSPSQIPPDLKTAIERACRPTSRYWSHLGRPRDAEGDHEIEIRIDVPLDVPPGADQIVGWRLAQARPERGMLFLRRTQPLTQAAVRALIADAVTLAFRYGGRFHSWTHERTLMDWKGPIGGA
jgi:hypothetical protein